MATAWQLDPDIVAGWSMPDFLDRQEYIWLRAELNKTPEQIESEKEKWKGPGSKV